MTEDANARTAKLHRLMQVFRPSGPIQTGELFKGRVGQLIQISDVCQDPGRHGVIFGEPGVGKTSLAFVSAEIQKRNGRVPLRIGCDSSDDFSTIWEKFFDDLSLHSKISGNGPELEAIVNIALGLVQPSGALTPDHVRKALQVVSNVFGLIAIFDEYNRIDDEETSVFMSDLIKMLSDQLIGTTILLVGVADDVETLVTNHRSIQRCLSQVRMPRMQKDEIAQIVDEGLHSVSLTLDSEVRSWLLEVPQGLPQYAHLLAREAGRSAILSGRERVEEEDFFTSIRAALDLTAHTMGTTYQEAISSPQKTIYEDVIIACALSEKNPFGFFSPAAVREPLSQIRKERYEIQRFRIHLEQLCERGPLLTRTGKKHHWRFRFIDPMMQPYAIMKGLQTGKIVPSNVPEPPSEQTHGP